MADGQLISTSTHRDEMTELEADARGRIFQDESTDCAICLGSLTDPDMEVIELTACGHRWHLECLKEQLAHAQPNPAQRLVLTGCRCAKCSVVCEHPRLKDWTRPTDILREKVDALLRELVLADRDRNDSEALENARQKYAFYLCSLCQEPYFGGTVACADTAQGEVPPEERLCVACNPQDVQCRHPLQHRGLHTYKCRYCCRTSSFVCYGTVHFCDSCHDRNSVRVARIQQQQQQQQRGMVRQDHPQPPACLEPIPCPGGDACPYPKKKNQTHHQNGRGADCEEVYGCAMCQYNPSNSDEHAFVQPPGSRNLLQNGCGQQRLPSGGWFHFNSPSRWQVEPSLTPLRDDVTTNFVSSFRWRVMGQAIPLRRFVRNPGHATIEVSRWQVEPSLTPLRDDVTTNFVSSFRWCVMGQAIPLRRFVRNPGHATIEVSAKYMARMDCASVFRLEALLLDQHRCILQQKRTDTLHAPADFWERVSLTLGPMAGAQEVVLVINGKDDRFWAGNFGSKVTDCQVRVLGSPEELERELIPEE